MSILEVRNVEKIYAGKGDAKTVALRNVTFNVDKGEFIGIMGESGSGKTTLLNIIATLDKPTSGEVLINGESLADIKDKDIAYFRRNKLGFVFQDFNLLDSFNNRDNIFLPLVLSGFRHQEMSRRIKELASRLDISELLNKHPYEISGGQRQRVAIGRAIITEPEILMADEPTGALDSASSDNILSLFEEINSMGQTCLMVTHSLRAAAFCKRVIFIKDGVIYHEIYKGDRTNQEFMSAISKVQLMLREGAR